MFCLTEMGSQIIFKFCFCRYSSTFMYCHPYPQNLEIILCFQFFISNFNFPSTFIVFEKKYTQFTEENSCINEVERNVFENDRSHSE